VQESNVVADLPVLDRLAVTEPHDVDLTLRAEAWSHGGLLATAEVVAYAHTSTQQRHTA
jgi:hypothetical protein